MQSNSQADRQGCPWIDWLKWMDRWIIDRQLERYCATVGILTLPVPRQDNEGGQC